MSHTKDTTPDVVTCRECGKDVPRRTCLGIGPTHRAVWICGDCINGVSMDRLFAPIGRAIQDAIDLASTRKAADL